jgi:phage terminase large subunit-like protein
MVVLDEVHSLKDWGMFDVMDTALGMRAQPSLIMITTAGLDRSYPCYEYRQKCIEVLEGEQAGGRFAADDLHAG